MRREYGPAPADHSEISNEPPPTSGPKRSHTSSTEITVTSTHDAEDKRKHEAKRCKTEEGAKKIPDFPCPFCEKYPELWSDEERCKKRRTISDLFRHHMDFHQRKNQKLSEGDRKIIDPKRFDKVLRWKSQNRHTRNEAHEQYQELVDMLFGTQDCDEALKSRKRFKEIAARDDNFVGTMRTEVDKHDAFLRECQRLRDAIMDRWEKIVKDAGQWKDSHLRKLDDFRRKGTSELKRRLTDSCIVPGPLSRRDHGQFVVSAGSNFSYIPPEFDPLNNNGDHNFNHNPEGSRHSSILAHVAHLGDPGYYRRLEWMEDIDTLYGEPQIPQPPQSPEMMQHNAQYPTSSSSLQGTRFMSTPSFDEIDQHQSSP